MYIVEHGLLYKTTEQKYKRYLQDFIANDGMAKLEMKLIDKVEDITNLSISIAKYNLYIRD